MSASRLSSRRRVDSGSASSARKRSSLRPEQLGAPVLDSLAGKEGVDTVLERGAQAGEPDVVAEQLSQLAQLVVVRCRPRGAGRRAAGGRACGCRRRPSSPARRRSPLCAADERGGARSPRPRAGPRATPSRRRPRARPSLRLPARRRWRATPRVVRHPAREQLQTLLIENGNVRGPAMEVDARRRPRRSPFRS